MHLRLLKTYAKKFSGDMIMNAVLPLALGSYKLFFWVSGGLEGPGVHAGRGCGAGGGWRQARPACPPAAQAPVMPPCFCLPLSCHPPPVTPTHHSIVTGHQTCLEAQNACRDAPSTPSVVLVYRVSACKSVVLGEIRDISIFLQKPAHSSTDFHQKTVPLSSPCGWVLRAVEWPSRHREAARNEAGQ